MSEDYTNLKYELIPYDNFVGSDAFDFNKTIYDLNSQIELLSSQADMIKCSQTGGYPPTVLLHGIIRLC